MAVFPKVELPENYDPYDEKLKKQFHPKADKKNYIYERPDGRVILACGAVRKGKKCKAMAGRGTNHTGYGRCKHHGGCTTGPRTKEGKQKAAQNSRKHGFYSNALLDEEREAYEELLDGQVLQLQHEIYALKAKILVYLKSWKKKYKRYYQKKLNENIRVYECTACFHKYEVGELQKDEGCPNCGAGPSDRKLLDEYTCNDPIAAREYAEYKTRVRFKTDGKGGYSYYTAGTIEDNALDRALNTLGRLVEKHARLTQDTPDDIISQINAELRAASRGEVNVSWNTGVQTRKPKGGNSDNEDRDPEN